MRKGKFELGVRAPEVQELQKIVCITRQDGRLTETTREAILKFLRDHNLKDPSEPDEITDIDAVSLRTASDNHIGC